MCEFDTVRIFDRGKTSFLENVNVLIPYVLRSRMRVREGSPKKKEIKKIEKAVK